MAGFKSHSEDADSRSNKASIIDAASRAQPQERPQMPPERQGTDAARMTQVGTRLQENSDGGRGSHLGPKSGESFAWNPADKARPNPQRPGAYGNRE
jgi:hypothetical protein